MSKGTAITDETEALNGTGGYTPDTSDSFADLYYKFFTLESEAWRDFYKSGKAETFYNGLHLANVIGAKIEPLLEAETEENREAINDLLPAIKAAIVTTPDAPNLDRASLRDLIEIIKAGEIQPGSPWEIIIDNAKAIKEKAEAVDREKAPAAYTQDGSQILPKVIYNDGDKVITSTDKLTNVLYDWMLQQEHKDDINGQRTMIKYEGANKEEITLSYALNYDEKLLRMLNIEKGFTDYDFFVMTACDNLYLEGNRIVSYTKIFHELGYDSKNSPGRENLEELVKSLKKGLSTIITMNDEEIQRAWRKEAAGGKYREIISPVIPIQIGNERFLSNGRIADSTIKINSISPLLSVAQITGHITTWPKEILRLYKGRRTKRYYGVMRYLLLNIGWMKAPKSKRSNKITYKALYEHNQDKTTRDKQNTRTMLYRLLDEVFIPAGYVQRYKEDGEAVILMLSNNLYISKFN